MSIGRPTQVMEHNLRQSLGAGVKAIVGSKDRVYCVIKHVTQTPFHKLGEEQPIIIDYIEIGRHSKCQILFDESQKTVSRRHAAIIRQGNGWIIKNLSDTNPTLVNGRPVNHQWFLNPGDQIQLSMEGPKMNFVMPANASIASLPISTRFKLFQQQALLPYRQGLIILGILFALAVGGLSYWLLKTTQQSEILAMDLKSTKVESQKSIDSLRTTIEQTEEEKQKLIQDIKNLKKNMKRTQREMSQFKNSVASASSIKSEQVAANFNQFNSSVYFIKVNRLIVKYEGEEEIMEDYELSGTGFQLSDGRFVTARHMVEPWVFFDPQSPDPNEMVLNRIVNNKGIVIIEYTAYGPGGTQFSFTNKEFVKNSANDEQVSHTDAETKTQIILSHAKDDGSDWAYWRNNRTGTIVANASISKNLPAGAELHIIGYPFSLGTGTEIDPLHSVCQVASNTLKNGMIIGNNCSISPGNSGGPVFYSINGQYVVIGIVSSRLETFGGIIPIANIK